MANKKISELDSRASLSLSDLMAVGDPATGYLYKTTISDLKTLTGAGVISFNGRVGTIVPTEGDYNLTQLGDVIITSVTNGQFLRYNGSNFVNTGLSASDIPDLSATYQPLDGDLTTIAALTGTGILKRTGSNTWSLLTDNTANWDTAYTDRNKWDGGSTGLVAATGRTSLGLVIGTNVQAWDADLDAIAALAGTSGFLKKTAANTWSLDTNTYLTTAAGAATYEPIITAGITAQYWRGDKTWQTLNTAAVAELTNLYFTDARARAAISASTGISYNSTTGAISSTITQYTDALARAAVSLTTTGSSGAATYNSTTGVLNVPTYTLSGLGGQPLDADLTAIAGLLGTSGFLKKTAADTWALDTNTYLTGNQTITLSGDVSGSGATTITTTIGAGKVTNAMLAGSIAASKLVGTDIATVGTITSGIWNGSAIGDSYISSAATWNAKEPAITAGTTSQYWRGDKTWQTLPSYSLPIATASVLGGVKIGSGVSVDAAGVISVSTNYQAPITLTTTGSSGASTFISGTLNIPNYGSALSGYLPLTGGTLTGALIGTTITTSANINSGDSITMGGELYFGGITTNRKARAYTTGLEGSATLNYSFWTGASWAIVSTLTSGGTVNYTGNITAANLSGTNTGDQTLSGLGGVPTSRTLTINGIAYDLSANRSWTVSGSQWTTSGSNIFYDAGYVGVGVNPAVKFHVESSGSTYSTPASNDVATIYVLNTNSSSVNAHSILSLRTTAGTGGNPFISWDISGVLGYAMGIDNADSDKLKINYGWSTLNSNTFMEFTTAGASTFNYSLTVKGIYYVPNTSYFVSGTNGYRFNSSGDYYNNFIIYDNGSFWSRTGGVIGGNTLINGTGGDNDPVLSLVGNSDNSYQWITRSINSGLNAGKNLVHFIGKEASTKNSGYFGYQWNANSSDSNFMTIGLYGANHILKLYGDNSAVFAGTITTSYSITANNFYSNYAYFNPYTTAGTTSVPVFQDAIYLGNPSNKAIIQYGNEFTNTHGSYIRFQVNSASAQNTPTTALTIYPSAAAVFANTLTAGDIYTTGLYSTGIVRSYSAQGNIRAYSTNPVNDAIIYAGWTSDNGIEMKYNPNSAIAYIQNIYPAESGQQFGDIHFRRKSGSTLYTTMLLKAYSANVLIGDTSDTGSRLQVTGTGNSGTPIINIVASGTGSWQRGVRMLNSGMVAGESIMYALGQADTAYGMGQFYYYKGSSTTQNRISMGLHSVDDIFNIFGNGNIGINTTSAPSYRFYVSGDIYATGDVIAYSDMRVKTNIRPIDNALQKITNSRGVIYDRTDNDDKNNIGFIAQELEKQFPELVSTDNEGKKGVKYQNAVAVLFEAIKEQQKQIDDLKKQVA